MRFDGGGVAVRVLDDRADAAAGVDDQLPRPRPDAEIEPHIRSPRRQRRLDVEARPVSARMQHAVDRMRALASERHPPVPAAVETDAELDQAAHRSGSLPGQDADRRGVAEPCAGPDRVGGVALGVVVRAHRGGDAALRAAGVGAVERRLGDDGDGAVLGGDQRGVESGQPAADHDHVAARHLIR